MMLQTKNDKRVTIEFVGYCSLVQVRYFEVVEDIRRRTNNKELTNKRNSRNDMGHHLLERFLIIGGGDQES